MRAFYSIGLALFLAGCGGGSSSYTVQGQTLNVVETDFAPSGPGSGFCGSLDIRGQFEVLMTDFTACSLIHAHQPDTMVFHGRPETNLRLIFPSTLTKVPAVNTFVVGKADCALGTSANGTQAVAIFSADSGQKRTGSSTTPSYDLLNAIADSGTITVTGYSMSAGTLDGSFDVTFGSDHLSGPFHALVCNGL